MDRRHCDGFVYLHAYSAQKVSGFGGVGSNTVHALASDGSKQQPNNRREWQALHVYLMGCLEPACMLCTHSRTKTGVELVIFRVCCVFPEVQIDGLKAAHA